ncbi:19705_t:CDS:2 [Entrophospora sp. SA101]|nr:19705_t:CDS:2 [Entrophospora sp. SA101]CAJ0841389.1 7128_t:CDS:2 [Entrophospora sp. SA101]CAJ0844231.1 12770_t:CDS:2 [Entrophospora sp. SA101]
MTAYELFQGLCNIWNYRPLLTESEYIEKRTDGSTSLGKKPDLQIILKQGTVEDELILAEVSRLFPQHDKEDLD